MGRASPCSRAERADADHSPCAAARASASRSRLSLSGLRALIRSRPSHPPLGARRTDDAVEPGTAVSAAPPRGPRGGVPGRATARWRPLLSAPGRAAITGSPGRRHGAPGSRRRTAGAARRRRAPHSRANRDARLAGRAPRRWICHRRLAPGGRARPYRRRLRDARHELTARTAAARPVPRRAFDSPPAHPYHRRQSAPEPCVRRSRP